MKSCFTLVYEIKKIFFSTALSNTGRSYPIVSSVYSMSVFFFVVFLKKRKSSCVNQMSSLFHSVASHFMLSAGVQKNHATHMNSR